VVDKFQSILEGMGVAVTVRRFLGAEADAACGQLRARLVEDAEGE
jgi:adenine C2-methylase RlmN of 23S rRNA A2503 and tRNA A37